MHLQGVLLRFSWCLGSISRHPSFVAGSLRPTKFGSWKPDFGDVAPNFFRLRRPNPTYLPRHAVRVSFRPKRHLAFQAFSSLEAPARELGGSAGPPPSDHLTRFAEPVRPPPSGYLTLSRRSSDPPQPLGLGGVDPLTYIPYLLTRSGGVGQTSSPLDP